jgi:isopenicillin N synthase-like dioxygenase
MQDIPVVSLARHRDGEMSPTDYKTLAVACEDHGFFILVDHGGDAVIKQVFAESADFFASPKAEKLKIFRDEANPLGYFDRELTKQKRDLKEVFDFKAGGYISKDPAKQTRWPSGRGDLRNTLTDFFQTFTALSDATMRMVFIALGMPQATIEQIMTDGFGELHSSTARLNYYPPDDPVPGDERGSLNQLGDMALHHHTDPGAITLLLQDDHGGLQANSKMHGWIDVPPLAGSIVVNIGDVLQVWTNDRCTAGMHRVLPVKSKQGRYSTPFFYSPKYDAQITPWVDSGDQARYRSFSWREFIRGRVTDNFADYGSEDIQIERYRVA